MRLRVQACLIELGHCNLCRIHVCWYLMAYVTEKGEQFALYVCKLCLDVKPKRSAVMFN